MRLVDERYDLCPVCMEKHLLRRVASRAVGNCGNIAVRYEAQYDYCERTHLYIETPALAESNQNAYRDACDGVDGANAESEISPAQIFRP